jgi:hypothetical protein
MDWRDPLFRVVVDVNDAVAEGGGANGNNSVVY